jgi:hypothetical protein
MSSLPPPPPRIGRDAASFGDTTSVGTGSGHADGVAGPRHVRQQRPGELTTAWRTTVVVAWAGIVLVLASVWRTSRTMGLSTWWLGPSADPQLLVVQLLPFVGPLAMVVAASRPTRYLPMLGTAASIGLALVAVGDLGRFDRLALLEFVAAGAGVLISLASFAGMLRSEPEIDRSTP